MNSPISITGMASLSAIGSEKNQIWENYLNDKHFITSKGFDGFSAFVSQLSDDDKKSNKFFKSI
jgi:hypothetical protein